MRTKLTPRYDGRCRELSEEAAAAQVEAGQPFVLRFRTPEGTTSFKDLIRVEVTFQNEEVDDWVLIRSDGNPTYNFVCVCDDAAMGITHVVRGEEHLVNTPKQILLYEVLGANAPAFAHVPLMLSAAGKKMSKRDGDTGLADYRRAGYSPEATVNFLALQGWALDGETEVFPVEQLIENFDLGRVSKGGSIFDQEKFKWMSGEYLRAEPLSQTAERSRPFVVAAGLTTEADLQGRKDWFERAVEAVRPRVQLYSEIPGALAFLFAPDDALSYDPKAEAGARKRGADGLLALEALAPWLEQRLSGEADSAALGADLKAWVTERGVKFPVVFQPLRCALTGNAGGPELADILLLLGAERVLARLRAGMTRLA